MIFKDNLYGIALYDGIHYAGTWKKSITINYQVGMGIIVNAQWSADVLENTTLKVEVSFGDENDYQELENGVDHDGWIDVAVSGNQDIYFKVTMTTTDMTKSPEMGSLDITISQRVTLYTLALDVMLDYGLSSGDYYIDPELLEYKIPYAWLDKMSHRAALRLIAEAGLAVIYSDREGIIRIEGPSYLEEQKQDSVLSISNSEVFIKNNPAIYENIKNQIIVRTQPLKPPEANEEVYRSTEDILVGAHDLESLTVFYDEAPVIDAVASLDSPPSGLSIESATYYSWGAYVTIENTTGSDEEVTLVVNGKPLAVRGSNKIVGQDNESIRDNGVLTYEFPDNPLVQTDEMAQKIADKLVSVYGGARRDIDMDWRGNPSLELGDRITAYDYKDVTQADFHVIRQQIEFDGTMRSNLKGRRVS